MIQTILDHLSISALTPMQEAASKAIAGGHDVVLLSPTGSGKTLAYLLPLALQNLSGEGRPRQLVLVPSRELALQTEQVFNSMRIDRRIVCCYGGRPAAMEKASIQGSSPDMIVGTPGRILDHLTRGNLSGDAVHTLILDEFDKCLELGFHEEMEQIISLLPRIKQRILLSATDAEEVPAFTGLRPNAVRVNFLCTEDRDPVDARLRLLQVISPQRDKLDALFRLLCTLDGGQTMVFANHRESVERIHTFLRSHKLYAEMYHGGLEQEWRERALSKFRAGSCNVLVSTDLASRGLDIPDVMHIVHYHLPTSEEAFTHRNGRTARWQASGKAFLLLHADEQLPAYVQPYPEVVEIPDSLALPPAPQWATLYIGKGRKDKINKIDILGFLCKKGNLSKDEVGKIDVRDHYAFATVRRNRMKQLLTLIAGEKIKGMKMRIEEAI